MGGLELPDADDEVQPVQILGCQPGVRNGECRGTGTEFDGGEAAVAGLVEPFGDFADADDDRRRWIDGHWSPTGFVLALVLIFSA